MKLAFKSIVGYVTTILVTSLLFSCTGNIGVQVDENGFRQTCSMFFEGDLITFDQDAISIQVKTVSPSWHEGDKVYIVFYNESSRVLGEAIYSTTSGWKVTYDGNLPIGEGLKCEVRYFVNATSSSTTLVSLASTTEIYEDLFGLYDYNGSVITVIASMTPKTGRIRFKGEPGVKILLTGLSVFTEYSPLQNTFYNSQSKISTEVGADGFTPYVYGTLANDNRKLGIIGPDFAFTRTCAEDVLKVGDSGYMTIPSVNLHTNWESGVCFSIGNVEFKMIPITGHPEGFYMIGETEVTTSLYNRINSNTFGDESPIDFVSYSSIEAMIKKLNATTQLSFSLPNSSQWIYAAKGGTLTKNNLYSGSNDPMNIAWFSANSFSSYGGWSKHEVKLKNPNELGIYDMSGNVAEFVSTRNGIYPFVHGGSYMSHMDKITIDSKFSTDEADWINVYRANADQYNSPHCKAYGVGFRLMLTCE